MPTNWQRAVQRNCSKLCEYLPEGIVNKMFERELITASEKERLGKTNLNRGLTDRNDEIVSLLVRMIDKNIQEFVELLEEIGSDRTKELADGIQSSLRQITEDSASQQARTEPTAQTQKALHEISNKISMEWNSLGIHLGISYDRLNQIDSNNSKDSRKRNMDMLMEWWQANADKSKNDRLEQLKAALIESKRRDIANDVDALFS